MQSSCTRHFWTRVPSARRLHPTPGLHVQKRCAPQRDSGWWRQAECRDAAWALHPARSVSGTRAPDGKISASSWPSRFSCSVVSNSFATPTCYSRPGLPFHHQLRSLLKFISIKSVMPSNHLFLCGPPPHPALNLSQHQGLFQGVTSSNQVAKVLELQFQHQSFQ